MTVSIIAALADNNCIGQNGTLPWHLPEDMRHFKTITAGHPVLMGRKTWESIPAKFRPLPGRTNIVITNQTDYPLPPGVERYNNIQKAIDAHPSAEIMVIGGAEIYHQTIALASLLYITEVHKTVLGDAFFPAIDKNIWQETSREDYPKFSFVTYKKFLIPNV